MTVTSYQYPTPALEGLEKWGRAAYAVACLQRYVALATLLDSGSVGRAISAVADAAWHDTALRQGSSRYDTSRRQLEDALSEYESDISPAAGDLIQRVATIALHVIGAMMNDDSSAKHAGNEAYGLQDLVASLALGVQAFDPTTEGAILSSRHVRAELDEQNADVATLSTQSSWPDALEELKRRSTSSSVLVGELIMVEMFGGHAGPGDDT